MDPGNFTVKEEPKEQECIPLDSLNECDTNRKESFEEEEGWRIYIKEEPLESREYSQSHFGGTPVSLNDSVMTCKDEGQELRNNSSINVQAKPLTVHEDYGSEKQLIQVQGDRHNQTLKTGVEDPSPAYPSASTSLKIESDDFINMENFCKTEIDVDDTRIDDSSIANDFQFHKPAMPELTKTAPGKLTFESENDYENDVNDPAFHQQEIIDGIVVSSPSNFGNIESSNYGEGIEMQREVSGSFDATPQEETNDKKNFQCSFCNFKTHVRGRFNRHLVIHSATKLFQCHDCEYACNRKGDLQTHLLTHSNTKLFKCSECDYACNRKGDLRSHVLTHSTTKLFKCPECDYDCNRESNLKRHSLTHTNIKLFKCSSCDYECNRKGNLKTHLLTHAETKLYKCTECDYQCNQKDHLKFHLLSHSDIKLFRCPECDYACNRKGDLKIHSLTHSKIKLFKCSECDYECNRKGNLMTHILTHSDTKLFKCTECDYECNQKDNLKLHILTHSDIKLFKCPECNYGCNRKGDLKSHVLTHSKVKLFKCFQCGYQCNRKWNFNNHLLSHSNTARLSANELPRGWHLTQQATRP